MDEFMLHEVEVVVRKRISLWWELLLAPTHMGEEDGKGRESSRRVNDGSKSSEEMRGDEKRSNNNLSIHSSLRRVAGPMMFLACCGIGERRYRRPKWAQTACPRHSEQAYFGGGGHATQAHLARLGRLPPNQHQHLICRPTLSFRSTPTSLPPNDGNHSKVRPHSHPPYLPLIQLRLRGTELTAEPHPGRRPRSMRHRTAPSPSARSTTRHMTSRRAAPS